MRGLGTEEASLHYLASGTMLEADSMPTGVGRMNASGWLLEATASEVENEEAQRWVRG